MTVDLLGGVRWTLLYNTPRVRPFHPATEVAMNPAAETGQEKQSFAEAALRLGGKSDEEARRLGAMDKADEQVETLFAPQYQTASSPIHRAVWDGQVPLELFAAPPLA